MENDVVSLVPLEDMALPDPVGWTLGEPLAAFSGTRAFEARGGGEVGVAFVTHARSQRDAAQERANVLVGLSHPSLIPVLATGPVGPFVYRLDADAPGPTAPVHARLEGPLAVDQVVAMGLTLAQVLGELHARAFVHGRVEPMSVRIDVSSGRPVPVLCDAASTLSDGPTRWSAPEVQRGAAPDPRSDLFGLGLVMLSLLTGAAPEVNPDAVSGPACSLGGLSLDSRLHALLVSMVDAEVGQRPRSATQVEDALARLRGTDPRLPPWKPIAAGVGLLALLGVAFAAARGGDEAPEPAPTIEVIQVAEVVATPAPAVDASPAPELVPAVPVGDATPAPPAPRRAQAVAVSSEPAPEIAPAPVVPEELVVAEVEPEPQLEPGPEPEPVPEAVQDVPSGPDVSGRWSGQANGRPVTFALTQSGDRVSGDVVLQLGGQSQKAAVTGTLSGSTLVLSEQIKRGSTYTLQLSGDAASGSIQSDGRDRGTLSISR